MHEYWGCCQYCLILLEPGLTLTMGKLGRWSSQIHVWHLTPNLAQGGNAALESMKVFFALILGLVLGLCY